MISHTFCIDSIRIFLDTFKPIKVERLIVDTRGLRAWFAVVFFFFFGGNSLYFLIIRKWYIWLNGLLLSELVLEIPTPYLKSGLLQTYAHYIRKLIDPFQPTIVRCHLPVYYVRERPFNLKGGLWFFSKKIFWFTMLLKKIFWFWWRKKK